MSARSGAVERDGLAMRPFTASLPMALLQAREATMRLFRPLLADHDLTEQQWRVLRALAAADEPVSVGAVADRTFLLGPSLSRIVTNLEARQLIERTTATDDQRRSNLELAAAGRALVARDRPGFRGHVQPHRIGVRRRATPSSHERTQRPRRLRGRERRTPGDAVTLTDAQIVAEAAMLDDAERTRTQIRQSTSVHPDMTLDEAYRVQQAWLDRRLARGEVLVGHKIGLTSRAMQAAMKITTPDSGFITDAMVFAPGATLAAADFCDPKVELELCFVLARDLVAPDPTIDDVLDATDHVTPAVELIAARSFRTDPTTGRARTVVDTVADNAADGGLICGGHRVGPREVDLRWVAALGYRNDVIEETGVAAGVLDHPARGIVWLARRYREQGLRLEAGQSILAGSFTRPIDVRSGDEFRFDYGELGSFGLHFS